MTKTIPVQEARWHTWGDDLHGRIFMHEGNYYRGIRPRSEKFFRDLIERGVLADLARKNLIVGTEPADVSLEGYALVLRHEKIPFISLPQEWSFSMLQDAAQLVIRLNRELLGYGLILADSHAFNVLFRGAGPLQVDIGSIAPHSAGAPMPGYGEFLSHYLYPLLLQERKGLTRIVKSLQSDELEGISAEEFRRLAGKFPPLSFQLGKRHVDSASLNGFLQEHRRSPNPLLRAALSALSPLPIFAPSASAEKALNRLERQIDAIRIRADPSQWGDYYDASPAQRVDEMARRRPEDLDLRTRQICEAIGKAKPQTLIDLAGNEGLFSLAASRLGVPNIVCADYDLAAVDKLYRAIRGSGANILPAYLNVMMPGGGSRCADAPARSVYARMRCEMGLALALTHHLSLTQRIPFETIAWTLAGYVDKTLLVEFMPFGLGIGQPSPNLPEWHTLEHFIQAFRKHFPRIDVLPTNIACNNRTLLVCDRQAL